VRLRGSARKVSKERGERERERLGETRGSGTEMREREAGSEEGRRRGDIECL